MPVADRLKPGQGPMDIPRPHIARQKRRRRILYTIGSVLALTAITVLVSRLKPAAPSVDRGSLYTNAVQRGDIPREVRGNGSLVPVEIRWVPAANAGRIERIPVEAGQAVKPDTVLVELSDPILQQDALTAKALLEAAEATQTNLQVQIENQRLSQVASVASAASNYNQAEQDYEVNRELAKDGLVPALTLKQSRTKAEELLKLYEIEKQRLEMVPKSSSAQLEAQAAQIRQLRTQYQLKQRQVEALKVRAGIEGIVQKMGDTAPLQVGQQVGGGANLARISDPSRLKAQIKIAETQIRDVAPQQIASIDTRNGVIPGHVVRIDPAAENGTVTVDVALDGPLPKGARPDLTVDGTIVLERLVNVLYVGRPVQAQPESTVGLFKVIENGRAAVRVPVKLGRGSVTTIEVLSGLKPGDVVILSDMSTWDAYNRVRLD